MKSRKGTAIITVLGLVSLICIVSGYIAYTASQEMHMSRVLRETAKAKAIAESGLNTVYSQLKTDFSRASDLYLEEDFGGGSYIVISLPDPSNTYRYKLVSIGLYGTYGRCTVSASVENRQRVLSNNPDDRFFDLPFDILGLGSLTISGNFGGGVDSIHGNGNVIFTGSSMIDALRITSSGTVTLRRPFPIPLTESGVPLTTMPGNLTEAIGELIAIATQNGEVYRDGEFPSSSPVGGIAVCNGLPAANWTGGTGCYIFLSGSRAIFNGITINNVDGYPSIVFPHASEVILTGNVTLNGAVLLPSSSLRIAGNTTVYGPLIIGQTMDGNGTANLYSGVYGQGFTRPPAIQNNVIISAWY